MRSVKAISRVVTVVFVVVVVVLAAVAFFILSPRPSPVTISSTSMSTSMVGFGPANSSVLIDDSSLEGTAPENLDPAVGYYSATNLVWNNVFQYLVTFVGQNSSVGVVVPELAQSYTVQNNQYYTFNIRPGVTFSDGYPLTAATVWYSFVRNLYVAGPLESFNFGELTQNESEVSTTGLSVSWGLLEAVQSATGLPTTTDYKLAGSVLNNLLSNFDPNNATIQKIMSYPQQAYVVTGPMTFVINLMHTYPTSFFLSDIAQWWAAIVDPSFIGAHGGVQANTPNTYFGLNCGPGTGPYYVASVGTGYSTVLLKANPTYWGLNVSNLSPVMQPAHIPVVVINYNLKANEKLEAFATNEAQLSSVDFPVLGQMWTAYKYKQYTSFNQVLVDLGGGPNSYWIVLNPGRYPTNNTDFRLAVVHAINYTQLLEPYTFNGTTYASSYLGPLGPGWGPKYYNPSNLPMYSYDIPLAISYMSEAGQQEHFSLALPNGTVIGDTSAPALGPLELAVFTGSIYTTLGTIISSDLSQIGLKVSVQVISSGQQMSYATAAETPSLMYTMWGPDWPDPVNQEIMYIDEFNPPGSYISASSVNQYNQINYTYVTQLINSLYLETNETKFVQGVAQLYQITYNYAPAIWMPAPDLTILLQPYVKGFIFSPYTTIAGQYWYNAMYYSYSTSAASVNQFNPINVTYVTLLASLSSSILCISKRTRQSSCRV